MNPRLKVTQDGYAVLVKGIVTELPRHISQIKNPKQECETCTKIAECITLEDRSLFCEVADKNSEVFQ
jgi:hypothetical protein